ncbi:MAG TPA: hypothetical protein VGS27_20635 [Candidatus Sulfotelmatobacter sp.]|nr:hypothetical protein [Candidatus Sulfotelmatobacter sp.]
MHAEQNLIEIIAQAAARKLTPQEAHAIGVSLVIRFGRGCEEARSYARHVNATREKLGLTKITYTVAGNPSAEERLSLFRSATEKLDDNAIAALAYLTGTTT